MLIEMIFIFNFYEFSIIKIFGDLLVAGLTSCIYTCLSTAVFISTKEAEEEEKFGFFRSR